MTPTIWVPDRSLVIRGPLPKPLVRDVAEHLAHARGDTCWVCHGPWPCLPVLRWLFAPALVQQAQGGNQTGTSATVTLGANSTAGNLVVVANVGNASAADGVSGAGVTFAIAKQGAFGNFEASLWYGIVTGSPGTVVTVTTPASSFHVLTAAEYGGIDTASPLLAQNDTDSGTGTAASTGPITGGSSPCLYESVLALSSSRTASSPTGSVTALTTSVQGVMSNYGAYRIDTTAAAITSGWTVSASDQWEMTIAAFKGLPDAAIVQAASLSALFGLRGLVR